MFLKMVWFGICFFIMLAGMGGCSTSKKGGDVDDEDNVKDAALERKALLQKSVELKVRKEVLGNGLTILVVENHHLPIYAFYTLYKVGSSYETAGMTGSSHFLEHLLFKSLKTYPHGKFSDVVEGNGGGANAYTHYETTVYFEWLPKNTLEEMLQIEADRMQKLTLDRGEFEKERLVILEERKMRYENQPRGKLYLEAMQQMFKGTPYEESVIGKIPDIQNVTFDQIMSYYGQYYSPNNAVIVIAGDFDGGEVLKLVKKYYEPLKPSAMPVVATKPSQYEVPFELGRTTNLNGRSQVPLIMYSFPGEPMGTQNAYVLDILSVLLSHGESSYLTQKYVKAKTPVAQMVSIDSSNLKYRGTFSVYAELLDGISATQFKKRLDHDRKNWCREAIDERSVAKAKNQYFVNFFDNLQTNNDLAHFLGLNEVFFGDYQIYQKQLDIYNSITADELMNVCTSVLNGKGNFVSVWEKNK